MLCPDCRCAAPGGGFCPQCSKQIPERESFSGQGGRYLLVLLCISALLFVVFALFGGFRALVQSQSTPVRISLYLVLSATPLIAGLYYWWMLREEEVLVTDECIKRRSRWGDEHLTWSDVREFRRQPILLQQTRLGRIAGLSRFFGDQGWPPTSYELIGPPDPNGTSTCMRLEPGTIDDLPWLLSLIEERIGPPVEG